MTRVQTMQFQRLKADGSRDGAALSVQFNPTEYTLSKGAQISEVPIPGLDQPILQFVRGQTESLSFDLFFDSTEAGTGLDTKPVTALTDAFYRLVKIDNTTHAPPILLVSWGAADFPSDIRAAFKCIVETIRQRYTLFSPTGMPLRAVLSITLKEYKSLADQIKELNLLSGDHTKSHVVQNGDTLSRIAWRAYGDPTEWRRIADANRLADPLAVTPGAVLSIPRTE